MWRPARLYESGPDPDGYRMAQYTRNSAIGLADPFRTIALSVKLSYRAKHRKPNQQR
jgi:hypothetical protein